MIANTKEYSLCWIHINDIKTFLYLGANEFEQKIGQNINISLSLQIKYTDTKKDLLENTVDYGLVVQFIIEKIKQYKKIQLLEFLIESLLTDISIQFTNLYAAKIKIEKGYVPLEHFTGNVCIEAEKRFKE